MSNIAPSDHALAQAVESAGTFDVLAFYRAQIERAANDKFSWEQSEERDAFIAKATEHLTALFRLCEEFQTKQLAELVSYLSWRNVYMIRGDDGVYTLHPTIN